MKCPNCGQLLPDAARFCNKCGHPIKSEPPQQIHCPHCGQLLPNTAQFCNNCGQPIPHNPPQNIPITPTSITKKTVMEQSTAKASNVESSPSEQPVPTSESPQPEPASPKAPQKRNSAFRKGVIPALTALLVLVLLVGWFWMNKGADLPVVASSSAFSTQSSHEPEHLASTSDPFQEVTSQASVDSNVTTANSANSESEEATPSIAEWGQQEIRITPTGSGMAELELLQQYQGSWTTLFTCKAAIGRNGTTDSPTEGDGKTPAGTFPVLFCYGLEQPQTGIPFVTLTSDSVWVDDSQSPYYNCLTTRQNAGDASFEDTYSQFKRGYYSCNLFFANNGDGRTPGSAAPGTGSVRVLEGYQKALEPTNGDIKISAQNMTALLGMLDIQYNPVVTVVN